jgi:hypothetical protein
VLRTLIARVLGVPKGAPQAYGFLFVFIELYLKFSEYFYSLCSIMTVRRKKIDFSYN